jgi:hypothetical protein
LTLKHIWYLQRTIPFIQNFEIRQIIFDIIIEIFKRGYIESDDIQQIVEKHDVERTSTYILCRIKTTGLDGYCNGQVYCFPGFIRTLFRSKLGNYIRAIFSSYSIFHWGIWGRHLTINGKEVNKGDGIIIGYTGHAETVFDIPLFQGHEHFLLDGKAVFILHEDDPTI